MHRRAFTVLTGLALTPFASSSRAAEVPHFSSRCKALEAETGGRIGVSCIDTASDREFGYRADERFPMCSTFKWLAVASLLNRVDTTHEPLDRRIRFGRSELLEWAPVTQHHVDGDGMSLAELCDAAIAQSDNTAANLILRETGGIAGWNRYVRSIGDVRSRLDRGEPKLNEARPGDVRDTTTPAAMTTDLRRLLLDNKLSPASREQLTQWMLATKTSDQRLRAGLPEGWRVADKTGTGNSGTGTVGDVGVLWPPSGKPIVLAVYLTRAKVSREKQEAAIASVGRWARELHA